MMRSFEPLHSVKNVVNCASCMPRRTRVNTQCEKTWTIGGEKFILVLDAQHQPRDRLRAIPVADVQALPYNQSITEKKSLAGIQRIAKDGLIAGISPEERQHLLAESLDVAARLNPFRDITDPVAWQREIRRDRPLPGREKPSC